VRDDLVCRGDRQVRGGAGNPLFRLGAENDEVDSSQVRQIQNALGRITAFHKVFGSAPGFGFRGDELAKQLFRGLLDVEPGDKFTGFSFRYDVE